MRTRTRLAGTFWFGLSAAICGATVWLGHSAPLPPLLWALLGTAWCAGIGLAVTAPLATALAQELFGRRFRGAVPVLVALEVAAATPSIIVGMVGLSLFVIAAGFRLSLVSGGLTLALVNLPFAARSVYALIESAPVGWMEGALALGTTEDAALRTLLLPALRMDLTRLWILLLQRSLAESAALALTVGVDVAGLPLSPWRSGATLAVGLWYNASQGRLGALTWAYAGVSLVAAAVLGVLAAGPRVKGARTFGDMNGRRPT